MKFGRTLFILITIIPTFLFATDSTMISKQKAIEDMYRALRSKTEWVSIDTVSLGGAVKPGYAIFKNSGTGIEVIVTQKYDKFANVKTEYFLQQGKPLFAYSFRYVYNRAIDYDSLAMVKNNDTEFYDPKKSKIVEERDYFEDGKLFKQITNLAQKGASSEEFLGKETYKITKELKRLKELYTSTMKVKELKTEK